MRQIDRSFAQTLLVIAVIAALIVIGFLWWDNTQSYNTILPTVKTNTPQTVPQLTPTPTQPVTGESLNTIETDFNKIDSTQYEKNTDTGLTQLGSDASAL